MECSKGGRRLPPPPWTLSATEGQYNAGVSLSEMAVAGAELLRALVPSPCVVCGEELGWGVSRVASCCRRCWDELPRLSGARCSRCALPWDGHDRAEVFTCIECQSSSSPLDWIDSWGHYRQGTVDVVHALKFARHDFLGAALSTLLVEALELRGDLEFSAVVPVPMHRAKRQKRGYNQAALLARGVARQTGIALRRGWLEKTINTQPQSSLSREDRAANVRAAYSARPGCIGSSILLVDDICTTGETLKACALALKKKGAVRVCAVTLARA